LEHIHADLKRIKELEEKKEPIGAIWYDVPKLASGSSYEVDYGYPKIRKISLVCESGKTATVEIKGTH